MAERVDAAKPDRRASHLDQVSFSFDKSSQESCGESPSEVDLPLSEPPAGLFFIKSSQGLTLSDGTLELRGDFSREARRLRPQALSHELLVRAARVRTVKRGRSLNAEGPERGTDGAGWASSTPVASDAGRDARGLRRPWAVDATAGLGEDALLLAAAGFQVTLYERDEVVAALLADALQRAAEDELLAPFVERMRLVGGDSIEALGAMASKHVHPDVVLLDPMFPERRKSAAVKKKAQLLQKLERPCDDDEGARLLAAACAAASRKVVIKRPAKGPWLAGMEPSYQIKGKTVRYDVIVNGTRTVS